MTRSHCKVPEIFRRDARANFKLRELGQRGCAKRRTSLQLLSESVCVVMQDKPRVQRRDDANLAQKSREKFAKFPEIRHAPRTKIARTRPACATHTSQRRRECIESVLHSDSKRKAASVGITQIFPPNSRERIGNVSPIKKVTQELLKGGGGSGPIE